MKLLCFVRSLFVTFLIYPLITFSLCFVAMFVGGILRSQRTLNVIARFWARSGCFLYGVRVEVESAELIPAGGAMFLFNHTSFFDIIALYTHFPFIRFGAKIELFSVPIFGWAMKSLGTLPIARGDRQAAIRVLDEAKARARRGIKFALSPEGGRNTEETLLPFKSGPFLFAIQAEVPLVPVIIKGALRVWPKGALVPATTSWHSVIHLKVLSPVPTTGLTPDARASLQAQVRASMESHLR